MHIYIDESGIFANPENKTEAVSCVGGLVLPDRQRRSIFKEIKRLTRGWLLEGGELKGSKLNEDQVSKIISVLTKYDVIFSPVIMEFGRVDDADITAHKIGQAYKMIEHITN
jgi:hypothetical protein